MSRLFVSMILVASALAAAAPPASAASLLVCDTCPYTTISAAIAASANGDTIVVRPGTYSGALNVNKDVTICSTTSSGSACDPNPNEVTIDGAGNIYPVFITSNGVTIQGFTIQNPTFVTTDQIAGGRIDPSLVVVFGVDNVAVIQNILQFPAAPLAPATSRWITDGVNVAEDALGAKSDNVRVSGNIFREFVEAVGPDGTCTNAPCRMAAIDLWGAGAAPNIRNNNMLLPNGRLGATTPEVVGIWGNANGALLRDNVIQSAAIGSLYGVKGTYTSSTFEGNSFYNSLHGLFLAGSSLTIVDNVFQQNNEGLRITARDSDITGNTFLLNNIGAKIAGPNGLPEATDLVFRENIFDQNTRAISIHEQVDNVAFDLRENDWGVYEQDQILLFIEDAGTGNTIDISCFIDEDGATRVCPLASIGRTIAGASWPRTVTLTDASTFPGSTFGSRAWTLPGGATSTASPVVLTLGPGAYSVGLTVTDANGFTDSATDSFILSNAAPVFNLADDYAASEGALLSIPLGATDTDGDTLTYTLLTGPPGASIVAGALKWTPTATQSGAHTVQVRVTDGASPVTDTTTINVANVPMGAPFDPAANLNLLEGASGSRNVKATSPSNAPIVLTQTAGPGTFVDHGNGQGTLSYTALAGSAGTYPVTIEAVSEGVTTTLSFNIVVTSTVGVLFTKVTGSTVQTTPGATVQLTGTIKNTGTGSDAFKVTAVSTKTGWTIGSVANVPLAAGASAPVTVPVTLPASGDTAFIAVTVCSVASPTTCQTQKWRVDVPIFITVTMEPSFAVSETPAGTVVVKYVNGAVAEGVAVIVTEASDMGLPLLEGRSEGTTDPTGTYAFSFDGAQSHMLGGHSVFIDAKRGDVRAVKSTSYDVTL